MGTWVYSVGLYQRRCRWQAILVACCASERLRIVVYRSRCKNSSYSSYQQSEYVPVLDRSARGDTRGVHRSTRVLISLQRPDVVICEVRRTMRVMVCTLIAAGFALLISVHFLAGFSSFSVVAAKTMVERTLSTSNCRRNGNV